MKKLAALALGLALLTPTIPANATSYTASHPMSVSASKTDSKPKPFSTSNVKPFGNLTTIKAVPHDRNMPEYWWSGVHSSSGKIYLQEYKGGKWVNVKTVKQKKEGKTLTISYTVPVKSANTTTSYRLHHPATSKVGTWTGSSQKVTYTPQKLSFYQPKTVWDGVEKRWVVNTKSKNTTFYALYGSNVRVDLQQKQGSKWVKVSSTNLSNEDYARGTISIPAVKKAGSYSYRLYANKGKYTTSATSPTINVRVEDPRSYTGYKKSTYNYVKKYCPNVIIDNAKPNKSWSGKAYLYEKYFKVVTGLDKNNHKFTSLHECAHIIQGTVYPSYSSLEKRANSVYKAKNGIEQMADCMTARMGGNMRYAYYTSNCTGNRGKMAAQALVGKKF